MLPNAQIHATQLLDYANELKPGIWLALGDDGEHREKPAFLRSNFLYHFNMFHTVRWQLGNGFGNGPTRWQVDDGGNRFGGCTVASR